MLHPAERKTHNRPFSGILTFPESGRLLTAVDDADHGRPVARANIVCNPPLIIQSPPLRPCIRSLSSHVGCRAPDPVQHCDEILRVNFKDGRHCGDR